MKRILKLILFSFFIIIPLVFIYILKNIYFPQFKEILYFNIFNYLYIIKYYFLILIEFFNFIYFYYLENYTNTEDLSNFKLLLFSISIYYTEMGEIPYFSIINYLIIIKDYFLMIMYYFSSVCFNYFKIHINYIKQTDSALLLSVM